MAETTHDTHDAKDINKMPLVFHAQYIKDLSFESPNAPAAIRRQSGAPTMDVNFTMESTRQKDEDGQQHLYEVSFGINVTAKRADQTVFIVELVYAALVSLNDIPESQHHAMLMIEVPRNMFPFARQIIAGLTQQAGFAPLLLSPVDFKALYIQQFSKEMQDAARAKAN